MTGAQRGRLPHFSDRERVDTGRICSYDDREVALTTASPCGRLLLVENDPRVRAALVALLSSVPGLEVVGACATAAEALSAAASTRPHLVLLDLLLPAARDGFALLDALHAQGIPVAAMGISGALRADALARGAVAFLEKDGSPEAFVAVLLEQARCAGPPSGK